LRRGEPAVLAVAGAAPAPCRRRGRRWLAALGLWRAERHAARRREQLLFVLQPGGVEIKVPAAGPPRRDRWRWHPVAGRPGPARGELTAAQVDAASLRS